MRELLLVMIDHARYGIWKDEVLDVRDLPSLHRLPLSPPCIAGMSLIENKTVMLADLPVCLGHASAADSASGRVLLLPNKEKVTGFVVAGDIGSLLVAPEALYAMPAYLTTPVINACAVRDNVPIPIVNIRTLSRTMLEADRGPLGAAPAVSGVETQDASLSSGVRIFSLAGDLYAVSAKGVEERALRPDRIVELAHVPRSVRGITFSDARVLPVIDLSQRVARRKAWPGAVMLVAGIGDASFGLLVDKDHGAVDTGEVTIKDLPPLARSSWLHRAMAHEGAFAPLIDLGALLSAGPERSDEKPPERLYAPDSKFPSLFGREEVEVVEFSLLGVRHALPKIEVEDVLDFIPIRPVPNVPQIVMGVAGRHGELLPVLDLATVFGRRSLATPAWRMVLVKNGDFRALVVTETVFGERRLALVVQRPVPITLPHRVVYGCYPEAEGVRLVLNVESIAAHFEKSLVKELLPALSREMRETPAKLIPSLLGEGAEARPQPDVSVKSASREIEPLAAASAATGGGAIGSRESPAKEEVGKLPEVNKAIPNERDQQEEIAGQSAKPGSEEAVFSPAREPERAPESGEGEGSSSRVAKEFGGSREETDDSSSASREPSPTPEESVMAGAASAEVSPTPEEIVTPPAEETKTGQTPDVPEEGAEGPSEKGQIVEAVAAGRETEEMASPAQGGEEAEPSPELPQTESMDKTVIAETVPSVGWEASQAISGTPSVPARETKKADQARDIQSERIAPAFEPGPVAPAYDEEKQKGEQPAPERVWRRRLVAGLIGAVLVALFYFIGSRPWPVSEKQVKEPVPPKIEQGKPEIATQQHAEKSEAPLVLEVPVGKPAAVEVYIVVKGDTLWSISERFTGNPFNYPSIAGENRIADPDRIFPGQGIRLKKKQPS